MLSFLCGMLIKILWKYLKSSYDKVHVKTLMITYSASSEEIFYSSLHSWDWPSYSENASNLQRLLLSDDSFFVWEFSMVISRWYMGHFVWGCKSVQKYVKTVQLYVEANLFALLFKNLIWKKSACEQWNSWLMSAGT